MKICETCGTDLPPSVHRRRFCSDACRKARRRADDDVVVTPVEGTVAAAVAVVFDTCSFDPVDAARAAIALALARLVDGGSVPAAGQLRAVLDDLNLGEDAEYLAFVASVQTPGIRRDTNGTTN